MSDELISIVVPVYNTAPFLEDCILSLVNQTYKNIELVFVNDGSTDNSPEILSVWEKRDSRIKVLSQKNGGVTQARKTGVNFSKGKWISFVDSDDVLFGNAIELLYKNISDCDIVIGQVKYTGIWPWPYVMKNEIIESMCYLERLLRDQIYSGPCAKLFKRELLLPDFVFCFPREISHGEDTLMNYRIACACKKIALISDEVYLYIYREKSASFCNKFDSFFYCNQFDRIAWKSLNSEAKRKFWRVFLKTVYMRRSRWFRKKIVTLLRKMGMKK